MGQTLQRAAQWTTATDGHSGKLEFSTLNEDLLNTVLNFAEGPSGKSPEEGKLVFKKPLTWTTALKPSAFSGSGYIEKYVLDNEEEIIIIMIISNPFRAILFLPYRSFESLD